MKIDDLRTILREQKDAVTVIPPERTALRAAADDNLEMVTAYLLDGDSFLDSGDTVNALAAYCYGSGWLHCGAAIGFLAVPDTRCPLHEPIRPLPSSAHEKIQKKTHRYERLLSIARAAVQPAAEEGTALHAMACRVISVTALYEAQGRRVLALRDYENALACFSYGHGWLDAAVRGGLFSVISERELFTI
jgi:hypothetical protein